MVAKGLSFTSKLYFAEIICDKAQLEICPTLEIIISLLQHNIGYWDANIRQSKLSFDSQHICILEAKKRFGLNYKNYAYVLKTPTSQPLFVALSKHT